MVLNSAKWVNFWITVFSGILTVVGIFTTPFSTKAIGDLTWGQVFSAVFVISVMILVVGLMLENNKLQSTLPFIKVRPLVSQHDAMLEVYDKGGQARFTANAKILTGHPDQIGLVYTLYWEPGGGNTNIDSNGIGRILVARLGQIPDPRLFLLGLHMFRVTDANKSVFYAAIWPLGNMGQIDSNKLPDDIYVQISISADKGMRKKFNQVLFRLVQPSMGHLSFEYVECKTRKLRLDKEGYLS